MTTRDLPGSMAAVGAVPRAKHRNVGQIGNAAAREIAFRKREHPEVPHVVLYACRGDELRLQGHFEGLVARAGSEVDLADVLNLTDVDVDIIEYSFLQYLRAMADFPRQLSVLYR